MSEKAVYREEAAKAGVLVTMEDPLPEETMDSAKERSPRSAGGDIRHLGALQCTRCLIPFANSKFQQRHMKREHPADFVAQKLQGALFICFTCARSFLSSKALIAHGRSHSPATRPSLTVAPTIAQTTFPCPDCGKTLGQAASLRWHRQVHEARFPPGPFACTECGQDFAQEAGLHQHYIRRACGDLWVQLQPSPGQRGLCGWWDLPLIMGWALGGVRWKGKGLLINRTQNMLFRASVLGGQKGLR